MSDEQIGRNRERAENKVGLARFSPIQIAVAGLAVAVTVVVLLLFSMLTRGG